MRIGIIGRGTIGGALAAGLSGRDGVEAVTSTTRASASGNVALVEGSEVVLLCVKPRDVEPVLRSIAPALAPSHVVVSTAASVRSDDLRAWSEDRARVVRVMPNTPARVGCAMTVLAKAPATCERALATARDVFGALGRTAIVDEAQMDAVTAVSGCGPAYAFVMMEAMIDAAIALGIPYAAARELVAQTLLGSARLVLQGDAHPAQLKHEVATPGGRTIRGLAELEAGGLRSALMRAVLAAAG